MKHGIKFWLTFVAIAFYITAHAQDAASLVKEGNDLANSRQYAAAAEKYKAALAAEPGNTNANYQLAFSLNAMGKAAEALPYLQKVADSDASAAVKGSAYSLMGSVYEHSAKLDKAIESYRHAVQTDSSNYNFHYNLGLAYFRAKQYYNAEKSARAALAIDLKHTGSIRLYALVTFHQDKRAPALLALCRYLSLTPTGPSSAEAYGNLQSILKGGALKAEKGVKPPVADSRNRVLNQTILSAANSAKGGTPSALLAKQLGAAFTALGPLVKKQDSDDAFLNTLATQYYELAQTNRMTAFANYVSQSADKQAAAWVKAHPDQTSQEW